MNKLFLMAFTAISMSLAISCNEREVITLANETQAEDDKEFLFSKDVSIQLGNTEATMRVHANTELALEGYSARNFQLVEVKASESLEDALVRNKTMDLNDAATDDAQEEAPDVEGAVEASLSFELLEVKNPVAGSHYAVSFLHPTNNNRAAWEIFTHKSVAGQNLQRNAFITRHSATRRVYYGVEYKPYSSSNWTNIISRWRSLSNNSSMTVQRNTVYQYDVTVQTKSSSAYTVSFF